MFGFLGFLLILFLLIVFIGFSILGNILRMLFGFGKRSTDNQNRTFTYTNQKTVHTSDNQSNDETESYSEPSSSSQEHRHSSGKKRKIFDDDEGEYVDYEEVK